MELKDILAISGQPGLFRYIAQSRNGVIVESLLDGKRSNASASSRVSALTEISMFTEGEDIPLAEVFTKMYAYTGGKAAISHKESKDHSQHPEGPLCRNGHSSQHNCRTGCRVPAHLPVP